MKAITLSALVVVIISFNLRGQEPGTNYKWVEKSDEKKNKDEDKTLPDDLRTEMVLFLKYDSFDLPAKRPKGWDKADYAKKQNHNEMVLGLNETLRKAAAKYPFRYKIVSMNADFTIHGAKYLLWLTSYDAFTSGAVYSAGSYSRRGGYQAADNPEVKLKLVEIATQEYTLIASKIGLSRTYKPDLVVGMLHNKIKYQFKEYSRVKSDR